MAADLDANLKFLKTFKGAKPVPDEIVKDNISPFRKYQNIFYTLPCHVRLKYIKYLPDYKGNICFRALDLFKEFPCEEFRNNPDAIDFKYYG